MTTRTDFSPRDFRDALSSFATGVTIVTAPGLDGVPVGMTASSFNSVSVDPPLILWSVTKSANSAASFKAAPHFAVHVLTPEQTDLSNRFAKSGTDKFAGTPHEIDANGVPVLPGTAARFDCRLWAVYEGGDHWIIVGEVQAIATAERQGLVFGGGAYSMAAPLDVLRPDLSAETGDVVGDMLQYQLSQAYHKMVVQFHDVVRSNGFSVDEWRICTVLFAPGALSCTDLASQTYLDRATLDDMLAGLAEAGLCRIDGDTISGTELGRDRVRHLIALAQQQERHVLGHLSPEEVSALKDGLRALVPPKA